MSMESPKGALLIALVKATQPLCLTECRIAHGGAYCQVNGKAFAVASLPKGKMQ